METFLTFIVEKIFETSFYIKQRPLLIKKDQNYDYSLHLQSVSTVALTIILSKTYSLKHDQQILPTQQYILFHSVINKFFMKESYRNGISDHCFIHII